MVGDPSVAILSQLVADFCFVDRTITRNHAVRRISIATGEVSTLTLTSGAVEKPSGVAIMEQPNGLGTALVVTTEGDHSVKAIDLSTMAVSILAG